MKERKSWFSQSDCSVELRSVGAPRTSGPQGGKCPTLGPPSLDTLTTDLNGGEQGQRGQDLHKSLEQKVR